MPGADRIPVYVFRDPHFAPAGDTAVSAAPVEAVVRIFGGGGINNSSGLETAFGGAAFFRDDATGKCHLGVWGARKAAKLRNTLRQSGLELDVIKAQPPGRLVWYSTK